MVITIIGILAAIAVGNFIAYRQQSICAVDRKELFGLGGFQFTQIKLPGET